MCRILTLTLPPSAKPPAGVRGLSIAPCPAGADATGLPADWRRYTVSSGGCACSLYAPPGAPADERVMRMRGQILAWAAAYGAVGVRVRWEGRTGGSASNIGRVLEMRAEAFLRDGFPPDTVVLIRGEGR
jgi:hypothetical protein